MRAVGLLTLIGAESRRRCNISYAGETVGETDCIVLSI